MNLSLFYIILVIILLILSMNRSTIPPCRKKTNFVAESFNRRFSGFRYYRVFIQNFLIFVLNCPLLLLFLFLLYIVNFFKILTEKSFTTFEREHVFCFHNVRFAGLRHRSLAEIGRIFIFALYLLFIFVVICQILCN